MYVTHLLISSLWAFCMLVSKQILFSFYSFCSHGHNLRDMPLFRGSPTPALPVFLLPCLEKSSFEANHILHQLILDVMGKATLGRHLYPFINKAKKKSNQFSYLVSIHLSFLFSYALFMIWINKNLKLD